MLKILGTLIFSIGGFSLSAQNVGIGTNTPQSTLDVRGNHRLGGTNKYLSFDSLTGRLTWNNSNLFVPTSQYLMQHSASAEGLVYGNNRLVYRGVNDTAFYTDWGTGAGYFRGNLGVGTTNPSVKLHVKSIADEALRLDAHEPFLSLFSDGVYKGYLWKSPSFIELGSAVGSNLPITIAPNGLQRMYIGTTGDVGIGTMSPSASLEVHRSTGNNSTASFRGTQHFSRFHTALNEDTYIRAGKDNGNVILNDIAGGKVGIGVSNPQQILSVNGGMNIDQANLNSGTMSNQLLRFGSNSGEAIGSNRVGGDNHFGLDFYTASAKRMVISNTGHVGIDNTNPPSPLSFASITGEKISLWGISGPHYGFGIQPSLLEVFTDGPGSDVAFGYGSSGSLTETMRIKGNGNVGIGTNSPSVKLDVAGNVKASAYQYNSPRTSYYSVPASAFQGRNSNDFFSIGTEFATYGSIDRFGVLLAAVNLPHGATVTSFNVHFDDFSPTVELDVFLCGRLHTGGTCAEMARITSSALPGNSTLTDNTVINPTINNQLYSYSIGASSVQPTGEQANWPASALKIRSVVITYTLNEAQ